VPGAIELIVHLPQARPIDVGELFARIHPAVAEAPDLVFIDRSGGEVEERLGSPTIQRQFHHPSLINQLPHCGRPGGDQVDVR
jgi:hypothetical protein